MHSEQKGETKPFTNFSVFHDNLISRLKSLSQIQLDFDKRTKEMDTKQTAKMSELKKSLDAKWKQLDKFETTVKSLAEAKQGWKRKFAMKEGEIDALKSLKDKLESELSALKRPIPGETIELKALRARADNSDKRLTNVLNQLASAEQWKGDMQAKWDARVKEYETRIKAADERVKRERQGAKESRAEQENRLK